MSNFPLLFANVDGSMSDVKPKIRSALKKAAATAKADLKLDNIDVICLNDKRAVIGAVGVGGQTPSRQYTFLYIDPSKAIDENEIYYTLCHEFHHARRYDRLGYDKTLFDSLISEGLAVAFEAEVSRGKGFISSTLRKRNKTKLLIEKCKAHFNDPNFSHYKWFISSKSNELPYWAGYEMGYFIVREYLTKHNKKASELVLEPPKTFAHDIIDL